MKFYLLILFACLLSSPLQAQYNGARYFWDIPSFFVTTPDVAEVKNRAGLGIATAFNVATHWGTARAGVGTTVTLNPTADDLGGTFRTIPFLHLEVGGGMYRTNGNKCAATHRGAFTAMPVLGLQYNFETVDLIAASESVDGLRFLVGVELGYFFIRDILRNTEIVLRGNYYPDQEDLELNLGFKFFLNMREAGRY